MCIIQMTKISITIGIKKRFQKKSTKSQTILPISIYPLTTARTKKGKRKEKGEEGKKKKREEKRKEEGEEGEEGKRKKRGGSPHPCKEPPLSRRRRPTLPHCGAVPSARPGLTSLFGMGRGGTPGPKPPEYDVSDIDRKQKRERPEEKTRTPALADMRKTHGADTSVCAFTGKAGGLLVLLGCGRRRPCTCSLSTSSSLTAL